MKTDTRNPLRVQLEIAETLIEPHSEWSAAELIERHGVSLATLNRYIAELRRMGARIQSSGGGKNPWHYRMLNREQCAKTVSRWLQLETARDLTFLGKYADK